MSNNEKLINLSEELKNNKKKSTKVAEKDYTRNNKKKENNILRMNQQTNEKSFRMISKIESQKRKGRYNVYINNEFAFGIDEEILIKFNLNKGTHVSSKLQKEIENEDTYYKAYERTLNYLNYSLRSEKQIRDYLIEHELDHFTERIIEHLKDSKLIDDLNYAQSYIRTMSTINQKGPQNIKQELYQRGLSDEDILTALDEYPYELQLENATELAEKRWKRTKNDSQFEGIQKVKQYLVNKGYSFEIADEAISLIDTEKDEEDEYNALVKQADKAHRRYARKYEGYELSQRLKAYLYSKAYPGELINQYLDERNL